MPTNCLTGEEDMVVEKPAASMLLGKIDEDQVVTHIEVDTFDPAYNLLSWRLQRHALAPQPLVSMSVLRLLSSPNISQSSLDVRDHGLGAAYFSLSGIPNETQLETRSNEMTPISGRPKKACNVCKAQKVPLPRSSH